MIFVVDYGLGNLLSVAKAFEAVAEGEEVVVSADPGRLREASYVILPGVGNFKTGMENLHVRRLIEPLRDAVLKERRPFLGICLGMQLLAEVGEENGETPGLGWIPGRARLLNAGPNKLPHIGWHDVEDGNSASLLQNIRRGGDFYFVHSYCLDCPPQYVVARCRYGESFPAVIQHENIHGTQFHPEKSRGAGLKILKNFLSPLC